MLGRLVAAMRFGAGLAFLIVRRIGRGLAAVVVPMRAMRASEGSARAEGLRAAWA